MRVGAAACILKRNFDFLIPAPMAAAWDTQGEHGFEKRGAEAAQVQCLVHASGFFAVNPGADGGTGIERCVQHVEYLVRAEPFFGAGFPFDGPEAAADAGFFRQRNTVRGAAMVKCKTGGKGRAVAADRIVKASGA